MPPNERIRPYRIARNRWFAVALPWLFVIFAVLWRKRHRWLGWAVVIVAFGQLFEGQYASAYPAAGLPSVHQPEIHAARDLVDVPVANRSIDINSHVTVSDAGPLHEVEGSDKPDWPEVHRATGAEHGAGIARSNFVELRVGILAGENRCRPLQVERWRKAIVFERNPSLDRPVFGEVTYFGSLNEHISALSVDFGIGRSRGRNDLDLGYDYLGLQGRCDYKADDADDARPQAHQVPAA